MTRSGTSLLLALLNWRRHPSNGWELPAGATLSAMNLAWFLWAELVVLGAAMALLEDVPFSVASCISLPPQPPALSGMPLTLSVFCKACGRSAEQWCMQVQLWYCNGASGFNASHNFLSLFLCTCVMKWFFLTQNVIKEVSVEWKG